MGYILKDYKNKISERVKPVTISLASLPNFVEFESIKSQNERLVDISLTIKEYDILPADTQFTIKEVDSENQYLFMGTDKPEKAGGNTFYLGNSKDVLKPYQIAQSLRNALIQNPFLRANFNITIPFETDGENMGNTIRIVSKGAGTSFAFTIIKNNKDEFDKLIEITGNPSNTSSLDHISNGYPSCEVQLDVYKNTGLFLGESDKPNEGKMGEYVTTLAKNYRNKPIWFNMNVLKNDSYSNEFLTSDKWCDAGTVQNVRLIAKREIAAKKKYVHDTFYSSNSLFVINGYGRNLENNDLSPYVYDTKDSKTIKPLTSQPVLYHVKGQAQFFNFLLSDAEHSVTLKNEYNLGITYRLYTQSKRFVAEVEKHSQNRKLFNIANTIKLDIDNVIGNRLNVGAIEVYLTRNGAHISEPLIFSILPTCLYKTHDFAFLNSLGGWSSFNFSGDESSDFKSTAKTMYKTQTPQHTISSEIESTQAKEIKEQFIVHTMPVDLKTVNWLKELSSSTAVYELSTKRYVVVDDLQIKPNSKDDLFRLEMKYHYSDSYNGQIK